MLDKIDNLRNMVNDYQYMQRRLEQHRKDYVMYKRAGLFGLLKDAEHNIEICEKVVERYKVRIKKVINQLNQIEL